jgi:DNA methylase
MNRRSALNGDLLELPLQFSLEKSVQGPLFTTNLTEELEGFRDFGQETRRLATQAATFAGNPIEISAFVNEFWTARQRQASRLHEISYRACFKPQLPRFFIERLTEPGERVYDPFMGRGTTPLEAALLGRIPLGCDVNPLSLTLVRPRLRPPALREVDERLRAIPLEDRDEFPEDLLAFYHSETLAQICALKKYLVRRRVEQNLDAVDDWIALVALNRLTGHSTGFFSVYTLPPNQAVSVKSQLKINARRKQSPPRRDVTNIILKKSRVLLSDCTRDVRQTLASVAGKALLLTGPSHLTPEIPSDSVSLVVTSPPFLDVVQYDIDNWLPSTLVSGREP